MSYRHEHEVLVDLPPERLLRAIADVRHWPDWDEEIAAIDGPERPVAGTRFSLVPNGGPRVAMLVEAIEPPGRFVDVALLPLARMRTSHLFDPAEGGTRLRLTIETSGPLALFWDRLVARKQARGAAQQTRKFLAYARARP